MPSHEYTKIAYVHLVTGVPCVGEILHGADRHLRHLRHLRHAGGIRVVLASRRASVHLFVSSHAGPRGVCVTAQAWTPLDLSDPG
jgi:hypothetical protein